MERVIYTHEQVLTTLALTPAEWYILSSVQKERLAKMAIRDLDRAARKTKRLLARA